MRLAKNKLIVRSMPYFEAECPKGHGDMVELVDGWLSCAFWCEVCKVVYEVRLIKMKSWDQEEVDRQLEARRKRNK